MISLLTRAGKLLTRAGRLLTGPACCYRQARDCDTGQLIDTWALDSDVQTGVAYCADPPFYFDADDPVSLCPGTIVDVSALDTAESCEACGEPLPPPTCCHSNGCCISDDSYIVADRIYFFHDSFEDDGTTPYTSGSGNQQDIEITGPFTLQYSSCGIWRGTIPSVTYEWDRVTVTTPMDVEIRLVTPIDGAYRWQVSLSNVDYLGEEDPGGPGGTVQFVVGKSGLIDPGTMTDDEWTDPHACSGTRGEVVNERRDPPLPNLVHHVRSHYAEFEVRNNRCCKCGAGGCVPKEPEYGDSDPMGSWCGGEETDDCGHLPDVLVVDLAANSCEVFGPVSWSQQLVVLTRTTGCTWQGSLTDSDNVSRTVTLSQRGLLDGSTQCHWRLQTPCSGGFGHTNTSETFLTPYGTYSDGSVI